MIKSMTGYGRAEARFATGALAVEIRSVNHRYGEVLVRAPRALLVQEEEIKRLVLATCRRGRLEVAVTLGGGTDEPKEVVLDRALARQYHRQLRALQRELKIPGTIDIGLIAGWRDLLTTAQVPADIGKLSAAVVRLTVRAVAALDRMRRREGAALSRDIAARIRTIQRETDAIESRAPFVAQEHFDRLKTRIESLMGTLPVDQARLAQELAHAAERGDITEEITRLRSHLGQFADALRSRESVGRTLDFLLQEIGREVNTVGSKANDADIAARVVRLKSELEKIREQVQNVE